MSDLYEKLGRVHARKALRRFMEQLPTLGQEECGHADVSCKDCLTHRAFEIFHDIQLAEMSDPGSRFSYPQTSEEEHQYNDAAMSLIAKTVERLPAEYCDPNYITHPEQAYQVGLGKMKRALEQAFQGLPQDDYTPQALSDLVKDRAWKLFEQDTGPRINKRIQEFYNRGVHRALTDLDTGLAAKL